MLSNSVLSWPQLLENLLKDREIEPARTAQLMQAWLAEELTPVQTGAFLAALEARRPRGSELAAMADVLMQSCLLPCNPHSVPMVDICGTGGDGANTFNISTAAAFTTAACGAYVAKHGNRSASSHVGSADVLEGLGLNLGASINTVVAALTATKVTFLFAPAWHPALVNLAPLRRSLGIRTVFNLLGPLVNPLRPQAQVIGVASPGLLDPIAHALLNFGMKRAVVVYGAGGLDEASLEGPNALRLIENGAIREECVTATDIGLTTAPVSTLRGGDLATNVRILRDVLQGRGRKPQSDVVALNAALALWAAGLQSDLRTAASQACESLASGLAWQSLERLSQALKNF